MVERKLTPEQKHAALQVGKAAGLCDGWHVEWNNRRKSKVWIAPGGVKTCWSLPQAVAWQIKVGIAEPSSVSTELAQKLHRRLAEEERDVAQAEARRKGLPEGWRLVYDNRRGCKAWISPCGSRRCYTVGKAVAWSIEKGLVRLEQLPPAQNAMSEEEVNAAMREARDRGLSDEWKVEWNYRKGIRVWICPETSKRCFSIAEALRKQNSGDGESHAAKIQSKQPVKFGKGSPTDLPTGWTIEWDEAAKRNVFMSANKDKKCLSIKEVLAWSLKSGLLRNGTSRSSVPKGGGKSQLTAEEKRKALKLAKSQGLGNGWTVEWDKKSMQRVWYAPNHRKKCQSLPEALAWASKNTPTSVKSVDQGDELSMFERPDSPKSDKSISGTDIDEIATSLSTKRKINEDLEIAATTKKQKLDSFIGASSLLALAASTGACSVTNTSCPSSVTSPAGATKTHAPAALLGAYQQHNLAAPPLAFGASPTTAQTSLYSRSILSSQTPQVRRLLPPSVPLSRMSSPLGFHSDGLAQDLLILRRSERLLASRSLQQEMLLDAALWYTAFPHKNHSLSQHPFLG